MIDLGREIASAVRADWSELREEVAWAGVRPRQRRRIVRRVGLACVVAAAVGGVLKLRAHDVETPPAAPIVRSETIQAPIASEPPPAPAPVRVVATEPIRVELARGARRFEVRDQAYQIKSGHVTIEAQNAVFACARSEHATRVEVFRGTVLVDDGATEREVHAGEQAEFREPVTPPPRSADVVEDLLHTADVMRLSHEPAQAIGPLRRIVSEHAGDRRAPLAAFTLGRVLLDELTRPSEAAAAFADAIRLAPEGPLVEDALARRVEALSRAGESAEARSRAEDYVRRFPHGRKLHAVRTFGGLP